MASLPENYDINKYDRPSVTVDLLVFSIFDNDLKALLIKRKVEPFKDLWALPGGFVRMNESLEEAALRELSEETGVDDVYLEQLYTFGDPLRDPRTRVITVAYFALIPNEKIVLHASTDASDVGWFALNDLPELAFDHKEILDAAIARLQNKIQYSNIVFGLLGEEFRLSELQRIYEIILNKPLDKRNFRKKMLSLGIIESTKKIDRSGAHRPAELFRFKNKEVVYFG